MWIKRIAVLVLISVVALAGAIVPLVPPHQPVIAAETTFGNDSPVVTRASGSIERAMAGSSFVCDYDGVVTSITAYTALTDDGNGHKSACGIYNAAGTVLLGKTIEETTWVNWGGEWKTYTFATGIPVTASTTYILTWGVYETITTTGTLFGDTGVAGQGWSTAPLGGYFTAANPAWIANTNIKYCIYATYTYTPAPTPAPVSSFDILLIGSLACIMPSLILYCVIGWDELTKLMLIVAVIGEIGVGIAWLISMI